MRQKRMDEHAIGFLQSQCHARLPFAPEQPILDAILGLLLIFLNGSSFQGSIDVSRMHITATAYRSLPILAT